MAPTYETIKQWMEEYFRVYSTAGQSPQTADRMTEYFAPDLKFIPFIAALGGPSGGFSGRDEFINTAKHHSAWYEKLTPINMAIDERRMAVAVLFGMQVMDRKTGKVAVKKSAMSHYELILDENKKLKIKTIRFFWEVLPPGVPEFYDLYKNDPV